ncbi:hypothetical protein Misp01_62460 [Microtetraspora sp. NBRC 13810]|uniref:carbonic anhydrase family protein n=1 Tax=Microtetraspora sp. NBRC 13810 TaxID=3030990 RepID=UPI0024A17CA5|nr:carbonic anhydrase family protein [Microtetraspora sp. NBRC 13810]GLW11118.1 hypothetical protein Misp01_62460 [Microtetraspora sp. NBRC 13810]
MFRRLAWTTAAAAASLVLTALPVSAQAHGTQCPGNGTDQAVQSPIEINRAKACHAAVPAVVFHYPSTVDGEILFQDKAPLGGEPSEHDDVRFIIGDDGTQPYITYGGARYNLSNVHFHGHAEHKFAGQPFAPIEAHFVHEKATGGPGYVVLSVMLDAARTSTRSEHDRLLKSPPELGETKEVSDIRLKDLLPESRTTYRYTGSLTTPDAEGNYFQPVNWVVFEDHAKASRSGIEGFRSLWPEDETNTRELQHNVPAPNIYVD